MISAWLCLGGRGAAQAVVLDLSACEAPAPSEVRALVAVELRERLVETGDGAQIVEVRCRDGRAELWLRGTTARRTVQLASVPAALRARLLALSVAELTRTPPTAAAPSPLAAPPTATVATPPKAAGAAAVRTPTAATQAAPTSIAETRGTPPPTAAGAAAGPTPTAAGAAAGPTPAESGQTAPPRPPTAADTILPATPLLDSEREPPACQLWAGLEAQATPLFGLGGSLFMRARVGGWLAWSSAFSLAQAHAAIDRGTLRVLSLSLRSGLALLLENAEVSLHIGAGVRAGWLQLSGEPDDAASFAAASFTAWYLGPALFAGATWRFGPHAFVALELELDHALREVRANVRGGNPHTLSPWRSGGVFGAGFAW